MTAFDELLFTTAPPHQSSWWLRNVISVLCASSPFFRAVKYASAVEPSNSKDRTGN